VKSYQSSRLSLSHSNIDGGSVHDKDSGSGSERVLHQYTPADGPIREESPSHGVLTRTNTVGDEGTQSPAQQQQQPQPTADVSVTESPEYIIRRQTFGELFNEPAFEFKAPQPAMVDEEKPHLSGQSHSTMTTEFSRQFEFVDAAETGVQDDAGVEDGGLRSAWSVEEMKRIESHADTVLAQTLPDFSATEHQLQDERDEADVGQRADDLTRESVNVAVERVSGAEPVPLTQAAILAAKVITLDILNRAMRDGLRYLERSYSASQCGPEHIKLASAIVRRLLDTASSRDTKWSEKSVQAAGLLIEDVLSSAVTHISRGDDVDEPDHAWSREAIQASCIIVRDVIANAARQASMSKQQTISVGQQQTSQSQPRTAVSQDKDLVDTEFTADEHDVIEQLPLAPQPTASPTSEIPSECECCYDEDSVFNDSRSPSELMF